MAAVPEQRPALEVALLEALLDLIDRCSSGSGSLHGNEAFLGESWQHLLVDAAQLLGLGLSVFTQPGVPEKWIIIPMPDNRRPLVSIACLLCVLPTVAALLGGWRALFLWATTCHATNAVPIVGL